MSNLPTAKQHQLTQDQATILEALFESISAECSSVLNSYDLDSKMSSLVGSAGTGKTYLTVQIVQKLIDAKISCAITAPTHKAAGVISNLLLENKINANSKTIHSFLGIKPMIDYATGIESFVVDKKSKRTPVDVLLVDESSMISDELFELILEALASNFVRYVIFVGDPNQLLPVNSSSSAVFEIKNQYKLTQIVRQAKDSYIIKLANSIKEIIESKKYPPLDQFLKYNLDDNTKCFHNEESFVNDFYANEKWWDENKILATYKNRDVDGFNRQIRNHYWIEKGVMKPEVLRQGDSLRFLDGYSVNEITIYHNGQEIVLDYAVKKYHEKLECYFWECKSANVIDQQIFRVIDPISEKTFNDKLQFLANKAKITPFPARNEAWKIYYDVKNMFANVQYIYASTIHKLQGSTYETCYINVYDLMTNNYMSLDEKYRLLYVAITRASKEIKIFMPASRREESIDTSKLLSDIDERLSFVF